MDNIENSRDSSQNIPNQKNKDDFIMDISIFEIYLYQFFTFCILSL